MDLIKSEKGDMGGFGGKKHMGEMMQLHYNPQRKEIIFKTETNKQKRLNVVPQNGGFQSPESGSCSV